MGRDGELAMSGEFGNNQVTPKEVRELGVQTLPSYSMLSLVTQISFIVVPPPKGERGFPPPMPRSCLHSLGISAMLPPTLISV